MLVEVAAPSATVAVAVVVHPPVPVTVTVYVPAESPVILEVDSPLLHK